MHFGAGAGGAAVPPPSPSLFFTNLLDTSFGLPKSTQWTQDGKKMPVDNTPEGASTAGAASAGQGGAIFKSLLGQ